jgi:hypothetical protein
MERVIYIYMRYLRWIPCQHGMSHPQVADGGDGLQRVAANIMNKQSLTADKGWSSSWGGGGGMGLAIPRHKK